MWPSHKQEVGMSPSHKHKEISNMKRFIQRKRIWVMSAALLFAVLVFGAGCNRNTGALNVTVNPASAVVVVTGPDNFTQTFTGNQLLIDLAPGQYLAEATATGFKDALSEINVVEGRTSLISLILEPILTSEVGALNVTVNPASTVVVVTGPDNFTQTFTGNQMLANLAPGQYLVEATATAFNPYSSAINVVAGQTSVIALALEPILTDEVGALNVTVTPTSAVVVVTGPDNFTQTFTGSQMLAGLAPGLYLAEATAASFYDDSIAINVVAGQTSLISLILAPIVTSELGALNITVTPASAVVVVTGPDNFTQTFTGNQMLADLAPGQYLAEATATAFYDAFSEINVVADHTSQITLILEPMSIISEAPRAAYRDGEGNLIPIDAVNAGSGNFIFHAWLEDEALGIIPANLETPLFTDPGQPLLEEQEESAPSYTQNLACSWVGYEDADGNVFAVIGADVRWEIDQWWSERVNSMQFGACDDNGITSGYGIDDDQAYTRTNNSRLAAERFPFVATEYPLYNLTGLGTPFVDGMTWVTLFSPDAIAAGRIVAVATINGEEIGKQILFKSFAPAPNLEITKTVSPEIVNLVDHTASVTWTVTVSNVGLGDATSVELNDFLASGAGDKYSLSDLPAGSTQDGDGFVISFPLLAGATETFTFTGTVTEAGTYCNEAEILSYSSSSNTWTPVDLNAQACFIALESNVGIIKDFVAADDTTSLGKSLTVAANEPARLRVRVINSGSGAATGVEVHDALTTGDLANYQIIGDLPGTPNAYGGFDTIIGDLAAGATATLLFTVTASVDGLYCDTVDVTATNGTIGIGTDEACLTVATPNLTITKVNAPQSVLPGATYTSTIVVENEGHATAQNVVISDELGLNTAANVRAIYVSSNLDGLGGVLAGNVVTANAITLPAGDSVIFTVVSRIPPGAAEGTYCDTATVTSSNADTREASDCVVVPAFSAFQTQLIDLDDPVAVGSNVTFFSALYVEALSNEGVMNNELTYSFGLASPTVLGIPGVFQMVSTDIYLDTVPVTDPVTGLILSDTSNPTAVLLTAGVDYTADNSTPGLQLIAMSPSVVLQPDTALYVVHSVLVPAGTLTNQTYTTSYIWDSVGTVDPAHTYEASSSEPTTVLP